jgi:hypothetical protein
MKIGAAMSLSFVPFDENADGRSFLRNTRLAQACHPCGREGV